MQHPFQISRKIEYGLRAMVFLASQPAEEVVPFREIAQKMDVPEDFLAKILKRLVEQQLVKSTRGARGGYTLARPSREITFLQVIEAVEGPVQVNSCSDQHANHDACKLSNTCTMIGVWRLGQQRMLEVFRTVTLDRLAMDGIRRGALAVVA